MIDIPETHMCGRDKGCVCQKTATKLVSCKFIVPARSPGEPVEMNQMKKAERRQACNTAAEKVATKLGLFQMACEALWTNPLSARCRRVQALAFSELAQAQFELSEAFTFVPPKEEVLNPDLARAEVAGFVRFSSS